MMARYLKGQYPAMVDFTPPGTAGVNDVNAGDVVVSNDCLLICMGGAKQNGGGTGITAGILGAMASRGGVFVVAAAGAIPVRTRVFWDPVNQQVTLVAGTNLQFGYTTDVAAVNAGDQIPVEFAPEQPTTEINTVAAAGNSQTTAALLSDCFNVVTGADGTKGGLLPPAAPGRTLKVKNASASVCPVYANTGDNINALSANAAISMAANSSAIFTAIGSAPSTWYTTPTVPS